jgi:DNA repair protein RadC
MTETTMNRIDLYTRDPRTPSGFRQATFDEILTGAKQSLSLRVRKGVTLSSPKLTSDYLIARIAHLPYEVFTLIYPD